MEIQGKTDQATWFASPINIMGQQAYQVRGYIEEECPECEAPRTITSSRIITQLEIDLSRIRLGHLILMACLDIRKDIERA